jgi:KDO2-lipid IV(A) lauroyltransferase
MRLRSLYRRVTPLRRGARRFKNALTYRAVHAALGVFARRSLADGLALADRLGDLVYVVAPRTRRLALQHLELAFGDALAPAARARVARAALRNAARCFCEVAQFEAIRAQLDAYVEVDGWEHAEHIIAGGRGAIAITGHLGNWELLAAVLAHRGLPVAAIARRIYEPRLNRLLVDFRTRNGVRTILRESPGASRAILQVLKANGVLAMLIDQDARVPSISVPFFGRLARTPVAAASLAIKRNLPVLAGFAARRPGGGHRITLFTLPVPHTGDARRDIVELTRLLNRTLEERIRANPAEWVWWHRRWRHGPIAGLDLDQKFQ